MPSKTRSTRKNTGGVTEKFITEFLSTLETAILFNTKKENYELLRKIQEVKAETIITKTKPIISKLREMEELTPLLTVEIFSKNVSFAALIYKNKEVYTLIKKTIEIDDTTIDKYLLDYIHIFTMKRNTYGGFMSLELFNKLWGQRKNVPWYFVLSLLSILWSSYVLHYSSIAFVNHIENNTAANFIKNTFSNPNKDIFNCKIEYTEKEQFYLDLLKKTKLLDDSKIDIIAKVFNKHRCSLENPTMFKENIFFHKMKIPREIEGPPEPKMNNYMESTSNALQVANPSLYLTLYNRNENENDKILHGLELKINKKFNNILASTNREQELTDYVKSMRNINKKEFKTIFFENIKPAAENPKEYSIFNINTNDVLKIAEYMGIDKSFFGLSMQYAAGFDVVDIIYDNFQQRMEDIKLYIEKTKLDAEYDLNKLIRHSRSLIKYTTSMVYFLIIYMIIMVNFMISSTLMGRKIWNYMRPTVKKEESLMVIQKDNQTNNILDILGDTLEIVDKAKTVVSKRTRKKTY